MEVPLAEIELDLTQSIKRRQIVGRTGKRGWRPKREESPWERRGRGNRSCQSGKKKKERSGIARRSGRDITNQRRGDS